MNCGIARQIARHCDEPEQPECSICFSAVVDNECTECEKDKDNANL